MPDDHGRLRCQRSSYNAIDLVTHASTSSVEKNVAHYEFQCRLTDAATVFVKSAKNCLHPLPVLWSLLSGIGAVFSQDLVISDAGPLPQIVSKLRLECEKLLVNDPFTSGLDVGCQRNVMASSELVKDIAIKWECYLHITWERPAEVLRTAGQCGEPLGLQPRG